MKKALIATLVIFSGLCAQARDPVEPVTPWPLGVRREPIYEENIVGIWFSCSDKNNCWYLSIQRWGGGDYIWQMISSEAPSRHLVGSFVMKDRYLIGYAPSAFGDQELMLLYFVKGELQLQIGQLDRPPRQIVLQPWVMY